MNYYNTLDIDDSDKENLQNIIAKILTNKCCKSLEWKDSNSKGYHIKMICSKKCDVCRFVFDDIRRFAIDSVREEKFKNVLFTEKEYIKPKRSVIKTNCERCEKYSKKVELEKRELSFDETIVKLKEGKIKIPLTLFGKQKTLQALFFGYYYFECPVCKWFKFVKINELQKRGIE